MLINIPIHSGGSSQHQGSNQLGSVDVLDRRVAVCFFRGFLLFSDLETSGKSQETGGSSLVRLKLGLAFVLQISVRSGSADIRRTHLEFHNVDHREIDKLHFMLSNNEILVLCHTAIVGI